MAVTITLTNVQVSTLTMDEAKAHFASALPAMLLEGLKPGRVAGRQGWHERQRRPPRTDLIVRSAERHVGGTHAGGRANSGSP
jgi:hypothetical protein